MAQQSMPATNGINGFVLAPQNSVDANHAAAATNFDTTVYSGDEDRLHHAQRKLGGELRDVAGKLLALCAPPPPPADTALERRLGAPEDQRLPADVAGKPAGSFWGASPDLAPSAEQKQKALFSRLRFFSSPPVAVPRFPRCCPPKETSWSAEFVLRAVS